MIATSAFYVIYFQSVDVDPPFLDRIMLVLFSYMAGVQGRTGQYTGRLVLYVWNTSKFVEKEFRMVDRMVAACGRFTILNAILEYEIRQSPEHIVSRDAKRRCYCAGPQSSHY